MAQLAVPPPAPQALVPTGYGNDYSASQPVFDALRQSLVKERIAEDTADDTQLGMPAGIVKIHAVASFIGQAITKNTASGNSSAPSLAELKTVADRARSVIDGLVTISPSQRNWTELDTAVKDLNRQVAKLGYMLNIDAKSSPAMVLRIRKQERIPEGLFQREISYFGDPGKEVNRDFYTVDSPEEESFLGRNQAGSVFLNSPALEAHCRFIDGIFSGTNLLRSVDSTDHDPGVLAHEAAHSFVSPLKNPITHQLSVSKQSWLPGNGAPDPRDVESDNVDEFIGYSVGISESVYHLTDVGLTALMTLSDKDALDGKLVSRPATSTYSLFCNFLVSEIGQRYDTKNGSGSFLDRVKRYVSDNIKLQAEYSNTRTSLARKQEIDQRDGEELPRTFLRETLGSLSDEDVYAIRKACLAQALEFVKYAKEHRTS